MAEIKKPPYRVPTMKQIATIRPNGYAAISLFAGCGGSSLGYRMAGFRVLAANEFIDKARETYIDNMAAGTFVDGRDIREVDPLAMLKRVGIKVGDLDVLDGSPPCSDFSSAGNREEGWGKVKKYSDKEQRVDDLFFEFIRFVRAMKPKVFQAENVSGLVKGKAKGIFLEVLAEMKASGYRVYACVVDAQWLGVPQARERLIFQGVRDDLGVAPFFPSPLDYRYSVDEALAGLKAEIEPEAWLADYAIGAAWDRLNPGDYSLQYRSLKRCDGTLPSLTITQRGGDAGVASVTHPHERRKFSIAELKRISGFPDDFALIGTYADRWERLGRAVPPVMMRALASAIRDGVLAQKRRPTSAGRR